MAFSSNCVRCAVALALALAGLPGTAWAAPAGRPRVVQGSGTNQASWFVAGETGAQYALPGGIQLVLARGTRLRVFPRPQRLRLRPGRRTPTWTVVLKSGSVDVVLPADARHAVLVHTPRKLSVIALGGRVFAAANGFRAAVANMGGRALVNTGSVWKPLAAGNEQVRSREDQATRQLAPAPAFVGVHSLWLATSATDLEGIAWKPMPGISRYRVVLSQGDTVVQSRSTPRPQATFRRVEPGRYALSVQAVDVNGITGHAATESLRVVGVALPDGAYADEQGAIHLGSGQQLHFTHAGGLEMTYSGAHRFFDSSSPIGLAGSRHRSVMLRVPNTDDTVTVRLERRSVSVETKVGPKWAVWPHDPVHITIRLRDRRQVRAEPVHLVPRVTLGVDPIKVKWHRDGDVLQATVAPRHGRGPWVLRVDVSDQHGIPLAHDFVEIAAVPRLSHTERVASRGQ